MCATYCKLQGLKRTLPQRTKLPSFNVLGFTGQGNFMLPSLRSLGPKREFVAVVCFPGYAFVQL